MANNIESKVQDLLEKVIQNLGYNLYDVEYVKEGKDYYLRITIDKEDGINIQDCEKVNDGINDILDEADIIKDQYFLEVSSPGLERVLKKEEHFLSQIGKRVNINLFKPIDKKKELQGILKEYNSSSIVIETEDNEIEINLKDIALVKTVFDFKEEF